MIFEFLIQQSTPELQIDVFDGNTIDFHYFMAVFL